MRAFALLAVIALFCAGCGEAPVFGDDLERAREAIAEKNWSLAERLLERHLRGDGANRWEAWLALLQCINSSGDYDRASAECLEAMLAEYEEDEEKQAYILERLGRSYESMRHYDRSAEAWGAYLELGIIGPEQRVEGYRKLAAMQFAQRKFDAGEESLRECLALPLPDHDKIYCLLDLADENMGRGNSQEVSDLAQQILDSEPDDEVRGLAGYLQADAQEQLGQDREALRLFEIYREYYPNIRVMDHRIKLLRKKLGQKTE